MFFSMPSTEHHESEYHITLFNRKDNSDTLVALIRNVYQ